MATRSSSVGNLLKREEWVTKFEKTREVYVRFEEELRRIVERVVRQSGVDLVMVSSRTKTVLSFEDKLKRKGHKYSDPLHDVTDLVGVRVVTYFRRDVPVICDALRRELDVHDSDSVDKGAMLDSDRFGYLSSHLVVALPEHRRVLSENREFGDMRAEVQVRTALQHAWATIEHKIRYKGQANLLGDASRGFSRLAAVLELADIEFDRLRDIGEETAELQKQVDEGDLEILLSPPALESYLLSSRLADTYESEAMAKGMPISPARDGSRELTVLLEIAQRMGLRTLTDLDGKLNVADFSVPVLRIKAACDSANLDPDLTPMDLLTLTLLSQSGHAFNYGRRFFDERVLAALVKAAKG